MKRQLYIRDERITLVADFPSIVYFVIDSLFSNTTIITSVPND